MSVHARSCPLEKTCYRCTVAEFNCNIYELNSQYSLLDTLVEGRKAKHKAELRQVKEQNKLEEAQKAMGSTATEMEIRKLRNVVEELKMAVQHQKQEKKDLGELFSCYGRIMGRKAELEEMLSMTYEQMIDQDDMARVGMFNVVKRASRGHHGI